MRLFRKYLLYGRSACKYLVKEYIFVHLQMDIGVSIIRKIYFSCDNVMSLLLLALLVIIMIILVIVKKYYK